MKRLTVWSVLALWVVLGMAGAAGAQTPFAWWKSEQFQRDLAITADQSSRINSVFQLTLPRLRQSKDELDRQEAELSRLIEADADEAQVARQCDKLETTRALLNKTRTLMLVRMRQVLSSDQRAQFKTVHDRWRRTHDGRDQQKPDKQPQQRQQSRD
jgi:Spy/CpxP family protein refolding chaperone